jgi:hypothetical protein
MPALFQKKMTVHFAYTRDLPPGKSYNSAVSIIKAPNLYSAGARFESRTVQRLSSLSLFIAASQSFRMKNRKFIYYGERLMEIICEL